MNIKIRNNTIKACLVIFAVLIAVHALEAIVLRMDESIFGENFINKVFGIAVMFVVLGIMKWKPEDIGFKARGAFKAGLIGVALALVSFTVAYTAEILILKAGGHEVSMGVFTAGFSLTGKAERQTGIGFILMCVFFNIINVVMEEGSFRGLFYHIVRLDRSSKTARLFQALLFGIWHIVTPLHNFIDGDIGPASFIGLSVGYIILAGLMGLKWSMLYDMTGNLYAGMADHFFNNCIATNLLHLTTESGCDEMMIVRVLIAQILSFTAVSIFYVIRGRRAAAEKKVSEKTAVLI